MPGKWVEIPEEAKREASRVDLLTYLQERDPGNLVPMGNGTYKTKDHDSLKISNGKWFWWTKNIGGASAVDYLMKVRDVTYPEAVQEVLGCRSFDEPIRHRPERPKEPPREKPELVLDIVDGFPKQVHAYLRARGLAKDVLYYCYKKGYVFQSKTHQNAVFVGYDAQGKPRYGATRGTRFSSSFKGELTGSDKRYAFKILAETESSDVHLFEAAIDLLSYVSLDYMENKSELLPWQSANYLSLAGVYKQPEKGEEVRPAALEQFLSDHPEIKTIHLHLDNDEVGRGATEGIIKAYSDRFTVLDEPPAEGYKDVNEELVAIVQPQKKRGDRCL